MIECAAIRWYNAYMKYSIEDNTLIVSGIGNFDLAKSCNCGQAFRWRQHTDGESWLCVVHSHAVKVSQTGDTVRINPCKRGQEGLFIDYFDFERDYSAIEASIKRDKRLCVCLPGASGIHVFHQEPFEALISFITSANNNIKRISGIIERLCVLAGEEIQFEGQKLYTFPTAERIATLTEQQLKEIGAGYRAPYIISTAKIIADGYELEKLRGMTTAAARKELLSFPGVGPKVADCILLFSLGHTDAFPIDVWIGRAMSELFFSSEAPTKAEMSVVVNELGCYSGIVQQYIFYYARGMKLGKAPQGKP